MSIESPIEHWKSLADAADHGDLFLDQQAAIDSDAACCQYLATLRGLKNRAESMPRIDGMGTFPSGILLANKFSNKVSGGQNSLVDVLQSHIDVVMAMQTVFRKFFDATVDVDDSNAAVVGRDGPK